MNLYEWNGINTSGVKLNGCIHAKTQTVAIEQLRKQRILVRKISKKRRLIFSIQTRKIKQSLNTLFTQHLATLIRSGISLSASCEILIQGQDNPKIQQYIRIIKQNIEAGCMLSESMSKYPQLFSSLSINLIKAGEHSGMLPTLLDKLDLYHKQNRYIKKKLYQATTYPFIVLLIGSLITGLLLAIAIPQFETLFISLNAELPMLTKMVIRTSCFIHHYWHIMLLTFFSTTIGLYHAYRHVSNVAKLIQTVIIRSPIIGNIVKKIVIARFTRTLAITFSSGLPLTDALNLVAEVMGNYLYTQATHQIKQDISNGETIRYAVMRTQLFPNIVSHLISLGEETGTLEIMLNNISDLFEEQVDCTIDAASHFLEPGIMAVLGIFVGILVVAMYLPILSLGSVV